MKNSKTTIIFIIITTITVIFLISCGGGGSSSSTPSAPSNPSSPSSALTTSNAGSASGAIITTIGLLIEPSYIGAASFEDNNTKPKSFLNALINNALANINKSQNIRTASGSSATTVNCTGGGTMSDVSSWTGNDSNPENYTGTITYTNCKEGTATWNGTTQITYNGSYLTPSKITTVLNNMTYTDTNTNLSLSGLTIAYADMVYNGNNITSASATITGSINGTINSKVINAAYNGFKMAYSLSGSNINISLSGKITPSCVNRELTVTTNTAAIFAIGSRCPVSGEITITDSNANAKINFTYQGGMSVSLNEQVVNNYALCSQSEGVCL